MLYLGCPMWGLKTWVGDFFPAKTPAKAFLALYSQRLNTVEGNTTFYALPTADTVTRWREEAAPGFRFCLKAPQTITHYKRLKDCAAETAALLNRLEILGEKAGPTLLQLPPTFNVTHLPALARYLAALPRQWRWVVEPRHADFFDAGDHEARFDDLLRQYGAAQGIFDTTALFALPADHSPAVTEAQSRKPRFPLRRARTAPFAFVRFVGQPAVADNAGPLQAWAQAAAGWLADGEDVFFFLHNPDDTHAPAMARLFHAQVSALAPVPPLPVWGAPPPPQPALW